MMTIYTEVVYRMKLPVTLMSRQTLNCKEPYRPNSQHPPCYASPIGSTPLVRVLLACLGFATDTCLPVYYDRILVMDAGRVAEFDTPLNLFDNEQSIFRSLCEEAGLTREHIVRIRSNVPSAKEAHS